MTAFGHQCERRSPVWTGHHTFPLSTGAPRPAGVRGASAVVGARAATDRDARPGDL